MLAAMQPTALVTGASRRVGRATALALAARGFNLVLTRHTSAAELDQTEALAKQAAAAAGKTITVHKAAVDLANLAQVEQFAASVTAPLDVLVLNASRYHAAPVGAITAHDALADATVNAVAPLLLTQGLLPALRQSTLEGGALVVALGDIHADGRPLPGYTSYLMSKAALHGMVQALAVGLAPQVRVNAILPGVVAWPEDADAGLKQRYEARIPLARPGTPEDVGRAVCALALELPYVTGQFLRLDGGRWLC